MMEYLYGYPNQLIQGSQGGPGKVISRVHLEEVGGVRVRGNYHQIKYVNVPRSKQIQGYY